jgi:hypothetical protein
MNRRICVVSFLALGLAFSAAHSARAQDVRKTPTIVRLRAGGLIEVSLKEAVLKELGLDHDTAKIAQLDQLRVAARHELRDSIRNLKMNRGGDRTKAREISHTVQARYDAKLKDLLTPAQFSRLKQIDWQLAGPGALEAPEMIQALGITNDQQAKLRALSRETDRKMYETYNPGGKPLIGTDVSTKIRELIAERAKKGNEILSQTQQEKFAQLKGKPIDVALVRHSPIHRTEKTALVIDIRDTGMQVSVNGGGSVSVAAIAAPRKQDIEVEAGEHQLMITTLDPVRQFTTEKSFSIQTGQTRSLQISIVDKGIVAKLDGQPVPLLLKTPHARETKN